MRKSERSLDEFAACFIELLERIGNQQSAVGARIWDPGKLSVAGDLAKLIVQTGEVLEGKSWTPLSAKFATIAQVLRNLHNASLGAEGRQAVYDAVSAFAAYATQRHRIKPFDDVEMSAMNEADAVDRGVRKGSARGRRREAQPASP